MKINEYMLCIPPYISTGWDQIRSLYLKGQLLVVSLIEGDTIQIPGISAENLEKIFTLHSTFLEQESSISHSAVPYPGQVQLAPPMSSLPDMGELSGDFPMRFGVGPFENAGLTMQHNSAQANMPDLPDDMLNKVSAIAKIVAPEDRQALPKAEPHCNCMHCQIARAIERGLQQESFEESAEEVPDEELQFQQWDIAQIEDKLFCVTNRLDRLEEYRVYLGTPVGCTCGKTGCDHVISVLKS